MKANVENSPNSPIEKTLTIEFPVKNLPALMKERLQKIGNRTRIDGFRPGKVPFSFLQQRYGKEIRDEIIHDQIDQNTYKAIQENKLSIVGAPKITSIENLEDDNVKFVVTFEVFPEITLAKTATLKIKLVKPVVEESDIDATMDSLKDNNTTWSEVDRAAIDGDQITIDFEGFKDDKPFEGGQATDFKLVLGKGQMIPGFEDALLGQSKGDNKTFSLTFPETYHAKDLAGENVEFRCIVKNIEAPKPFEINEEYIQSIGIKEGTVEALREDIKKRLENEAEQLSYRNNRQSLFDLLLEKHDFPIPQHMIDEEIKSIIKQIQDRQKMSQSPVSSDEDLKEQGAKEDAVKRVKLGLILRELIVHHDIKLDEDLLNQTIEEQIVHYPNREEARKYFTENKNVRADLENSVLEKQIINVLMESVKATFEQIPLSSLRN